MIEIKIKDEKEVGRKFLNIQYVKMKKVAAVGSMILLAINLSLTVFPYVQHRFPKLIFGIIPNEYVGIPIVFVMIVFVIMLGAHLYVKKLEMYRTEQMAEVMFNPYSVYALAPFQEMIYSYSAIPMMKALLTTLSKDSSEYKELKTKLGRFEEWCVLGYIPKEDFPDALKKYYLTDKQQRL